MSPGQGRPRDRVRDGDVQLEGAWTELEEVWGQKPPRDRALTGLAIGVVVVVGLAVLGGVWAVRRPSAPPGARPTALPMTVLVELVDGKELLATGLVALGPGGAAVVLLPSTLLVKTSLPQPVVLSSTLGSTPGAMEGVVSRALGVRLDGSWRLSVDGLSQLVDAAGGVVTDVDREVRTGGVVVAAGAGQRLSGTQAVAFVSVGAHTDGGTVGLSRFGVVLGQALAGLPTTGTQAAGVLGSLGEASTSTLSIQQLGGFLATLVPSVTRQGLRASVVPVIPTADGEPVGVQLDVAAAQHVVRRELPGTVLASRSPSTAGS